MAQAGGGRNPAQEGAAQQAAKDKIEIEQLAGDLEKALEAPGAAERETWALRARVLRLQAALHLAREPEAPQPGRGHRIWTGLLRLLEVVGTPLAVVILGVWLKSSFEEHLEVRRLELAEERLSFEMIQALEAHFAALLTENIGNEEAYAAAARIARFGPVAIAPMVAELAYLSQQDTPRAMALKKALILMAADADQREEICGILKRATAETAAQKFIAAGLAAAREVMEAARCQS